MFFLWIFVITRRKRGVFSEMNLKFKPQFSEFKGEISEGDFPEYLSSPDESEYRKINPS